MVLKLDTSKLESYIGMNDKKEKYINFSIELEDATGDTVMFFWYETLAEGE
jgi:hypothetical protein